MGSSESNHSAEVGLSGPSMNSSLILHKASSSDLIAKHEKCHASNSNTRCNTILNSLECSKPSYQSALVSLGSEVSPAKVFADSANDSALASLGSEVSPAKANDCFDLHEANTRKVFTNLNENESHEVLLATAIV
jgi:hypothetical protein